MYYTAVQNITAKACLDVSNSTAKMVWVYQIVQLKLRVAVTEGMIGWE